MNDRNSIFTKVQQIVADANGLDVDEIELQSDLRDDLGLDSLDIVELTANLEKEFNLRAISDSEVATFYTVEDLVDFIQEQEK